MKELPDPKAIRLVARLVDLPEGLPGIEVPCSRCGVTCFQKEALVDATPVCVLCITASEVAIMDVPEDTKQALYQLIAAEPTWEGLDLVKAQEQKVKVDAN